MKKLALPRLKSLMPQPRKKVSKLAANMARQLAAPPYDDYEDEPTTKLSTAFVVVLMLHLVAVGGIYGFHQIKKSKREAEVAATPDLMSEIKRTSPVTAGADKGAAMGSSKAVGAVATAPGSASQAAPAVGGGKPVVSGGAVAPVASIAAGAPKSAGTPAPAGPAGAAPGSANAGAGSAKVGSASTGGAAGASAVVPVSRTVSGAAAGAGAGTVLAVSVPSGNGSPATAGGAEAGSGKTYVVQKGDNPVTIAKRLGVAQEELLKLNAIEDPKKLKIGQVLKVPAKRGGN